MSLREALMGEWVDFTKTFTPRQIAGLTIILNEGKWRLDDLADALEDNEAEVPAVIALLRRAHEEGRPARAARKAR